MHERSREEIDELSQYIRDQGQVSDPRTEAMTEVNIAANSLRAQLEHASVSARRAAVIQQ